MATNFETGSLTLIEKETQSDHYMIGCNISISSLKYVEKSKLRVKHILNDLTDDDILEILTDKQFPQKPFLRIAIKLGKTR